MFIWWKRGFREPSPNTFGHPLRSGILHRPRLRRWRGCGRHTSMPLSSRVALAEGSIYPARPDVDISDTPHQDSRSGDYPQHAFDPRSMSICGRFYIASLRARCSGVVRGAALRKQRVWRHTSSVAILVWLQSARMRVDLSRRAIRVPRHRRGTSVAAS